MQRHRGLVTNGYLVVNKQGEKRMTDTAAMLMSMLLHAWLVFLLVFLEMTISILKQSKFKLTLIYANII